MSAWKVFSESTNPSIQNTRIVTAFPSEHLAGVVGEEAAAMIKAQQAKIPCLAGFLWAAKPDRYETARSPSMDHALNTIHLMDYLGSSYDIQSRGGNPTLASLQANNLRNCVVSRCFAQSGAPHLPLDLAGLYANNSPPKWNELASSNQFQSIVASKPWGVVSRQMDRTASNIVALVTLFINVQVALGTGEEIINQMTSQLPGSTIEQMVAQRNAELKK